LIRASMCQDIPPIDNETTSKQSNITLDFPGSASVSDLLDPIHVLSSFATSQMLSPPNIQQNYILPIELSVPKQPQLILPKPSSNPIHLIGRAPVSAVSKKPISILPKGSSPVLVQSNTPAVYPAYIECGPVFTASESRVTTITDCSAKPEAIPVKDLKQELDVAEIISTLSSSVATTVREAPLRSSVSTSVRGDSIEYCDKSTLTEDEFMCRLCIQGRANIPRQPSAVGERVKNFKLIKTVRHMSTQFTTQYVNIKSLRHVSAQTARSPSVCVQTSTQDISFSKTVETQYWPSPLWSKYILDHPEVVYNLSLGDLEEFPPKFQLYKLGGQLYSTLFGPKWQIQRKPSMRCISVSEFGGPDVLRVLASIPTPKPHAKQVLINVKAAGVNPVDTYIRSGTHAVKPSLPYTPGKDGSGIVQQVGEEVTKVKRGDRVWFFGSLTGSYAEYCICKEDTVGQLPKNLTFEEGAMVGTPYMTAYRALLLKAKVKRGETVFIHGGTGGVGTAAIQICHSFGIHVIATAGSDDGFELLTKLGVEKIYNHRSASYLSEIKASNEKIDVILEMLADKNLENDLDIIAPSGRIVIIGCRGSLDFNPRLIMKTEATICGVMLFKMTSLESEEQVHYLNEGLNIGWVKPPLWQTYELKDAVQAHLQIIENNGSKGQIVLKINPSCAAPEYVPTDI